LGPEQTARLPGLCQHVKSAVLGVADPGLVAKPKIIIFPDLDIIGSAVLEFGPSTAQEVEIPPNVAYLQLPKLQATGANQRRRRGREAVEPAMQKGPADRAAAPAGPGWCRREDARARRVRREGQQQEASDRFLVDGELVDPMHGLEAHQRGCDPAVITRAVHRDAHAKVAVPALYGVEGMFQDGNGGLESQAVPDVRTDTVIGHGQQSRQDTFPDRPSQNGTALRDHFGTGPLRTVTLQREHVQVVRGERRRLGRDRSRGKH
jgi:hypothetical protein